MPQVADANKNNWVDTYAPNFAIPFLRLARADRPIGVWLLLWPCWWSFALAKGTGSTIIDFWYLFLFLVGATVMRAAGCIYNDILDRKIDAKVERTKFRPIPSGQITVKQAFIFMILCCLVGLAVLLQFNTFTVFLGISSLLIVSIYPLMKRITYWPQFVLGLAFSWGALMGWASVKGQLDWPAVLLYLAVVSWTIGYDTIYAHQDKEDDALLGLKSTALKFGEQTPLWLTVFYGITIIMLLISGIYTELSVYFFIGLLCASAHLVWQIYSLDINASSNCLIRFRSNKDFGLIVFLSIIAGHYT